MARLNQNYRDLLSKRKEKEKKGEKKRMPEPVPPVHTLRKRINSVVKKIIVDIPIFIVVTNIILIMINIVVRQK